MDGTQVNQRLSDIVAKKNPDSTIYPPPTQTSFVQSSRNLPFPRTSVEANGRYFALKAADFAQYRLEII